MAEKHQYWLLNCSLF